MPIMNYKQKAETSKKAFFERKDISKVNKKHMQDFIEAYERDVSPARVHIFFSHIWQFLKHTDDIKKDMNDRKLINNIFNKLKSSLNANHYATILNVTKRYVKWLNDGTMPIGFKDIKPVKRKELRRSLDKSDMVTWDDGLVMGKHVNSIQWKAIILTQLDGGFRPSEFVDLDYGDVEQKDNFLIVHVKDGKTGERNVILFNSVPYLIKWLHEHPTKEKNDPLWVMEFQKNSRKEVKNKFLRYEYPALRKRLKEIGKRAKINKPLDFYNLRHSACRLAKLNNMPIDLASKKFGHSAEFFLNVYGRLDTTDELSKHAEHLGLDKSVKKQDKSTIMCDICKYVNPPLSEVCGQCGKPLTLTKALEMKSSNEKEVDTLKQQLEQMNKRMHLFEKAVLINKLKNK